MLNTARALRDMEVLYLIFSSEFMSEGYEAVQVYGLKAVYYGNICSVMEIPDISCRKEDVARLIERLDHEYVEPDQLIYIVEDYLAKLYTV